MKTPKHSYPLPAPKPGWSWVYGKVQKGDHFKPWRKNSWEVNPVDIGTITDGPDTWFTNGNNFYLLSGFIRKNK